MKSAVIFAVLLPFLHAVPDDEPFSIDLLTDLQAPDELANELNDEPFRKTETESNQPLIIEEFGENPTKIFENIDEEENPLLNQEIEAPEIAALNPSQSSLVLPEVLIVETEAPTSSAPSTSTGQPFFVTFPTTTTTYPQRKPSFSSFSTTRSPFSYRKPFNSFTTPRPTFKKVPEIKFVSPSTTTQKPKPSTPRQQSEPQVLPRISSNERNAKVLENTYEINPDGTYNYLYKIDNGINAAAEGTLKRVDGDQKNLNLVVRGFFSWLYPKAEDNVFITYTADENGYHPEGSVIPTPPPTPPQIARALEFLRTRNLLKV